MSSIRAHENELPKDNRAKIEQKRQDEKDQETKTKFYDDCVELVSSSDDLKHQLVNRVISLEEYRARVELVTQKANELIAI
jgi:hypothetical protein